MFNLRKKKKHNKQPSKLIVLYYTPSSTCENSSCSISLTTFSIVLFKFNHSTKHGAVPLCDFVAFSCWVTMLNPFYIYLLATYISSSVKSLLRSFFIEFLSFHYLNVNISSLLFARNMFLQMIFISLLSFYEGIFLSFLL